MKKFNLCLKNSKEVINKVKSSTLVEAINFFSVVKNLKPNNLLELYHITEEN
jgi:hypothetical protein